MKRNIVGALVAAAVIICVTPVLRLLHVPDGEVKVRAINVMLGLLVVWTANSTPKRLKPLSATACSPEWEQDLRRTAGFLIFAGGLLYSLAWVAAPMSLAFPLAMTALGGATLLTLASCVLSGQRRGG